MRGGWAGLAMLVAGCVGPGGWTKAGADTAAIESEYRDCRAIAASAVKTEADIDQDIRATRYSDWQRGSVFRLQSETTREHTSDRAAAIVTACMRAKGFAEPR